MICVPIPHNLVPTLGTDKIFDFATKFTVHNLLTYRTFFTWQRAFNRYKIYSDRNFLLKS